MSRVYIGRFSDSESQRHEIRAALAWIRAERLIKKDTRVCIKPNLTWRQHIPGVTVTPAFLEALVEVLIDFTDSITIVESEGGQSCFHAEDGFKNHGLYQLRDRFGIRVVNLSKVETETCSIEIDGKKLLLELPRLLLRECDCFVTLPVPKIHSMTRLSLALKNQWGCLGDHMRVTSHPEFDEAIIGINMLLKPSICIFDGTHFLDRTGPMIGEPVAMNMVIASDDLCAASDVCCRVMQIDPMSVGHHRVAARVGIWPTGADIELNSDPMHYVSRRFELRRAPVNYIQLAAFKSRLLNKLFYDSVAADALHKVLWTMRRSNWAKRFLYGRFGPGEANRGGAGT